MCSARGDLARIVRAFLLCALAAQQGRVHLDDTLAAELVQQADEWDDSDNLPIEVLLHPPYRCAFISCPGIIDPEIIGFFPFIVRDMDKGTPVFMSAQYTNFSTLTYAAAPQWT